MPPKRKSNVKAAVHRVGNGLRYLFRSHPATESNTKSTRNLKNTDWDGLERFSGVLMGNLGAFGPLKSSIDRFSECVKMFEEQARAREEHKKLGNDLNDLFTVLAQHFEEADPARTPLDSFGALARGIDEETKWLDSEGDSRPNNDGDNTKGVDEILGCYRWVRTLLALFAMNESAKMWRVGDDEANTRLKLLHDLPNAHYRAVGSTGVRRTGCTPTTHIDVLQDLRDWIHYGKFQKVYWLSGIAGTGKTTIAYSLCQDLENSGKPAASFFCSRDLPECRDVKRIFPSVAYQLSQLSRPFRCAVSSALEQDPEVCNQPIDEQFKRLLVVPLQNVGHTFGVDVVVVIDGLEECEDKDGVDRILNACFQESSGLPVRFLITSRRNPGMLGRMLASQGGLRRAELRLHEVDRIVAQQDVRTYLNTGLEGFGLSDTDLERLAKQSGGSFVYATSVIKYLTHGGFSGMAERLKRLLGAASWVENANNQHIDTMYTAIIEEALDNSGLDEPRTADMMLVLRTAVCARESLTLHDIAELLGLDFSTLANTTLHLLLPTMQVSTPSGLGITLHESFSKYLIDRQRSGRFHCDGERDNAFLAQSCLRLIGAASPAFNICDLDSSYLLDREVADIDEKVNEAISPGLWYAARHWGTHLALTPASDDLLTGLHDFLSGRLLLWMEVVNLRDQMPDAAKLLHSVHIRLQVECPTNIQDLLHDSWMFVEAFSSSAASESTAHIYISALGLWPADRPVSTHYMPMLRSIVKRTAGNNPYPWHVGPGEPVYQPSNCREREVWSVAYSPDGAHIASGYFDGSIRIWDAQTGQPVGQPLNGHTGAVNSVAYSPDGAYIASGSGDRTVRIWDAHTGQPVGQPFGDHTHDIWSIVYSPDGAYIASGSGDGTVRIWRATTGQPVRRPLKGHTDWAHSVAYSPDGAHIASGSFDGTVRIWDTRTGMLVGESLDGPISLVSSVVYSPDGAYIASGCGDGTVRIWDAQTGQAMGQPLHGHRDQANSVAYSPDGAYITSGSNDRAIRIWDAHTGKPVGQPLNGHADRVNSVVYSPSGAYIASGSSDGTVRIWDAHIGRGVQLPEALSQPNRPGTYPANRSLIPPSLTQYVTRISKKRPPAINSSPMLTRMSTNLLSIFGSLTNSSQIWWYRSPGPSTPTAEILPHHWVLDDHGWVVNARQERVIWVPHDLRGFIVFSPTVMIIPLSNHVILDFRDAKLGTEWRGCFDSSRLCT